MPPKKIVKKPAAKVVARPDRTKAKLLTKSVKAAPKTQAPVPGGGGVKPAKKNEKQRFIWAEGQQESGGDYEAVNAGSGALGRWQVMPANLPGWLKESGQQPMTPYQYLHNHKAQDRLANVILGGDYDRYGPAGAAAVWYSGQPNPNATYGDPPVYQYVADVLALMDSPGAGLAPTPGEQVPEGPQPNAPTPTKADSWDTQVKLTASQVSTVAKSFLNSAKYIKDARAAK